GPVDVGKCHELADVVGLHASAVDDVAMVGSVAAEPLSQALPDVRVCLAGLFGGRVAAGSYGPHRLVGNDEAANLIAGHAVEPDLDLTIEDLECLIAFAFLERLTDADDRRQ